MINSINLKHLPIQDLVVSGLIIFIMSTVITNIYNLKFYINNFIDILIANLPTTQPFRFGNNDLELTSLDLKYISFPMYVNMLSWNGKYKITYR